MKIALDIRRAGDYGVGTYVRNVVHHLARSDRVNTYFLIGKNEQFDLFDPLPENFRQLSYSAPPGSFRTHLHLPGVLYRHGIDLLHMPWFYAPAIVPCRLVITVHDLTDLIYPPRPGPHWVQSARPWFAKQALRKASRIVAVSQATKRELTRLFRISESKIEVIYNALDESFSREAVTSDAGRVLERWAVKGPFVLYAGNIKPQKNLPRLIEAFAVAKADLQGRPEFAGLKLVVIGDELTSHPDLRRAVIRARVREDVRFLGFVPAATLRVFYSRARAFLFPSLHEGFGLPPLEAMAHSTPVVTSNTSSLPEIFGDAAVLVNPENVFEIARGIRQVLTDDDLRRRLIERGAEVVKRFSWDKSVQQLLEIYKSTMRPPERNENWS